MSWSLIFTGIGEIAKHFLTSGTTWAVVSLIVVFGTSIYTTYKLSFRSGLKTANLKFDSFRTEVNAVLSKGSGKFGVIVKSDGYSGTKIHHVIEVEEMESAGDMTKTRVVKVCSKHDSSYKDDPEKVLASDGFNEWVKTSEIVWYNDNNQRLRDEKLENILKN